MDGAEDGGLNLSIPIPIHHQKVEARLQQFQPIPANSGQPFNLRQSPQLFRDKKDIWGRNVS